MVTAKDGASWWQNPAVIVGLGTFLLLQGVTGVIWITRLDGTVAGLQARQAALITQIAKVDAVEGRLGVMESKQVEADRRILKADEAYQKIGIIEERQRAGQIADENSAKKIDAMLEQLVQLRDETLRVRPLPPGAGEDRGRRRR